MSRHCNIMVTSVMTVGMISLSVPFTFYSSEHTFYVLCLIFVAFNTRLKVTDIQRSDNQM